MKVLTVYAHHDRHSLCHAILDRFGDGLKEAGHTNEIVDLYAIGFDPVLRAHDRPNWIDDSVPDDVLAHWQVERSLMRSATGPLKRFFMKRWIGGRNSRELARRLHDMGGPRDVAVQQQKVARAEALVFIAPVYFLGFPAILKGWIERVFTLGFAFGLTPDGWRGDIRGRLPLLKHKKALIINTTIFDEQSYKGELAAAMKVSIDDFALRYPGVQQVEHVYFHAVHGADDAARQAYLQKAYELGKGF